MIVWKRAVVSLATMIAAALPFTGAFTQEALPTEEFVGPFASWHQVQCGGADDTAVLSSALKEGGTAGASPVLFITPGTCRITTTLTLGPVGGQGKQFITILGADPATTRIV